ncbi:hypothetical protein SBC1_08910 [Caballeronia sp. SBC1]|uniref:hypothetical protein n=1 Tax=Caballeronia sp. SBC1 TaxID=2705548 RepID=UPI00140900A4|nr:hypothetical protein [Caballeronia sp. SBC1]QIN60912.1 hypothetical protein SBC1_08910 [Caballeronia sp. SBC1]
MMNQTIPEADDLAPAIAFERIVAACLELEWQIMPRVYQRSVKAVREPAEEKSD